ncbi:MAS20 protein import receptor domain-containing protein [Ditylenchus destructor]|uniref:MAS20 protein import receptor domain-containing protein n=1 Tax=Ditylenchus destructor TaxID=166010 RepID=A0AAD4NH21_9BILA|nr:MAS20 protein import receptor domain-containing protein [Ditylenchus destructor]
MTPDEPTSSWLSRLSRFFPIFATETKWVPKISKTTVGLIFAGIGCAFVGYAIYFDYKRRTARDYKAKLRLRRKMESGQLWEESPVPETELPDTVDYAGLQQFFLQEVQLGEEKLLEGFVEEGIQHLAMAIVMCNKPDQVITIFRRTLADEHFTLLQVAVPKARLMVESGIGQGSSSNR